MASVKQRINKKTGKPYPRWTIQYFDYRGVRKTVAGYTTKKESEELARKLEDKHRQIRDGLIAAPGSPQHSRKLPFKTVMDEYLAWGKSMGWSAGHSDLRSMQLKWWKEKLKLSTLADLDKILPKVEKLLRELAQGDSVRRKGSKRSTKTVNHYANTLKAFTSWCVDREYLHENPLRRLKLAKCLAGKQRRAMTPEEITGLLNAAPRHRRVLYQVALSTGLRANELRSLSVADLDIKSRGISLRAEFTKNKKAAFQHLPEEVHTELKAFVDSGEARQLYERAHGDNDSLKAYPKTPLLYVPRHTAAHIRRDLKAAGIVEVTHEGSLDFHALRTTFVTLILDAGATVREAMTLARHGTPSLTMNTYGRTREKRLPEIAEQIGAVVGGKFGQEKEPQ